MAPLLEELLAREWAGELTPDESRQLAERCAASPDTAAARKRFRAAMAALANEQGHEPSGPAIHRAYAIPARERTTPAPAEKASVLGVLRLVYDSLRPAQGLRGVATDRRHLLLESDLGELDVFIDDTDESRAIEVVAEFSQPIRSMSLLGDAGATVLQEDGERWIGAVGTGTHRVVLTTDAGTCESEAFDVV